MNFAFYIYLISFVIVVVTILVRVYIVVVRPKKQSKVSIQEHKLERHESNPVISPRPHNEWETQGTLNPAAVTDDSGKVHLLYRSIGADGLSNIGHAKSTDGLDFSHRSSFPVYRPEIPPPNIALMKTPAIYDPTIYTSGGGWGGFEDPRAVRIEDRIYMTYVDFQGWDSVRIGLTSIAVKDLEKEKWNWKKPKLISPAGQVNKNWVLFPEKVNGKFAILHSISPEVMIDYVDRLDNMYAAPDVKSRAPRGGRESYWDNWVRGAGPPPIKTDIGWLLLYHAMDKNDPDKYKLGAMILDSTDPSKILYRSPQPILTPEMPYENDGKPGVVYASGAIVKDGNLMVYYGGGDKHVCVAQTPLKSLLEWLVAHGKEDR